MDGRVGMSKFVGVTLPCRFLKRCFTAKCVSALILFTVITLLAFSYLSQYSYRPGADQLSDPANPILANPGKETDVGKEADVGELVDAGKKAEVAAVDLSVQNSSPVVAKQPCSSKTNIVFIKVHKAGSTTMANLLARYALNHDLNIALPEQKPVGDVFHCFGPFYEYRVLPLAKNQPYQVLFNHMIYNRTALDNIMPENTFYVAIMRQPVKRFLSGIYYFGNLRPPAKNNTDNAAFKRFISKPSKSKVEKNFRIYNSVVWNTGLPLEEQQKKESVKKHIELLDKELDLMMVMEHFLESLVLFKRMACLSLRDIMFMKINSRKVYKMHEITKEDMEQLKSWQMADHMVYDHFYAKFWELVRKQGGSFKEEVDHFGKVIERVSQYCSNANTPKFEVLVIQKSKWNEEFSLNERDCQLMKSDERGLQKQLLTRAKHRREKAGYRETRAKVPDWRSDC